MDNPLYSFSGNILRSATTGDDLPLATAMSGCGGSHLTSRQRFAKSCSGVSTTHFAKCGGKGWMVLISYKNESSQGVGKRKYTF